ncbi:MAG: glycosyltransferase [Bacteroidota bacterium]
MKPKVSFIVCTYNREKYIYRSLESIAVQNADKNDFELIAVNNNSTDSTDSLCKKISEKFPGLNYTYIIETEQGLSAARNRGMKEAKGDVFVFMDDDAFAEKEYSKNIITFYEANPDVMATGGRTYPQFEEEKPKWMSHFLMPLVAAVDRGEQPHPFPRNMFPIGANMAFRRKIMEEVGFFDVNLGRKGKNLQGGEEKDLFNRIRAKGYQPWYLPSTKVHHIIPANRMTTDYIRKQARGIGFSENVRASSLRGSELLKSRCKEILKWFATFFLFLFYLLTFRPIKGFFLFRFRLWVSQGMFLKKE